MGWRKVFNVLGIVIFGLSLYGCVKNDDFDTPDTSINIPEIEGDTISIKAVKALFAQEAGYFGSLSGDEQFTFYQTHYYMTGYVISSDESGNFYQELILQDKPENPAAGVKIALQSGSLYTKFEIGRKVYVELDGFTIGFSNGVMTLGVSQARNDFVAKAPRSFEQKIIRTTQKDSIVPLKLRLEDFVGKEKEYELDNLYVELEAVQFAEEEVAADTTMTFAGEADDYYDAVHALQNCEEGLSAYLITSTFSSFKSLQLPGKRGIVRGILTKTYNGADYAVKLNSPSAIIFEEERCEYIPREEEPQEEDTDTEEEEENDGAPSDEDPDDGAQPPVATGELLFPGGDFEDWNEFISQLSTDLKYADHDPSNGIDNSGALRISGNFDKNDYVFEINGNPGLQDRYTAISFYLKGRSAKSVSVNLYKEDENNKYYVYNLKDVTADVTVEQSGRNAYSGEIDTGGEWVSITLDITGLEDINLRDSGKKFLAFKIGNNADYELFIDEFRIK